MARWSWSDRAAAAVLATAALVHLAAVLLALHPRVGENYAARYIARTSRCLQPSPPPVVAALPARLLPYDGQRCPGLLGTGWHPAEPGLAWSAEGRAAMVFTLAPELPVRRLTLYFARMLGASAHPRTLRVLLDGVPVAAPRIASEEGFAIAIPGERLVPGATHRIELLLDRLYTQDGLGLGTVRRSLGVAFGGMVIE